MKEKKKIEKIYFSRERGGGGGLGSVFPYGMFTSEYPSSEHLSKLR